MDFWFKSDPDKWTTHPKFNPTGVWAHDIQIMDSTFHVHQMLVLTTKSSGLLRVHTIFTSFWIYSYILNVSGDVSQNLSQITTTWWINVWIKETQSLLPYWSCGGCSWEGHYQLQGGMKSMYNKLVLKLNQVKPGFIPTILVISPLRDILHWGHWWSCRFYWVTGWHWGHLLYWSIDREMWNQFLSAIFDVMYVHWYNMTSIWFRTELTFF